MMGRDDSGQEQFFYAFKLEDYVPEDHLLRGIDRFLDLSDLHDHLAPYYSSTGRPSIDPELMMRMLIIGYCFGIRSERRICEEVQLNLAYRWFCRLSMEDKVPDHSTFSKNRHGRFREADAFRYVFEQVLERCIAEGLVGGEGFAVDASVVEADASRRRHQEDDDDWGSGGSSRAVREYIAALEEAGPLSVKPSKKVSKTDPSSNWTAVEGGRPIYAYSTNYLVDTRAGMIMDVEGTPWNRIRETDAAREMVQRVEDRFGIKPRKLIGDTAYGSAPLLGWLVEEKGIEPHVPVWDKSQRQDGTLSRWEFTWCPEQNEYRCPHGKALRTTGRVTSDNTLIYRSRNQDCKYCGLKSRCCPNTPCRKITRSVHEAARDEARRISRTPAYERTRKQRKQVEMLFGHMKRILKVNRLRLRGLSGAKDEFLLTATAQNLRRMAKYLGTGPPGTLATAVP